MNKAHLDTSAALDGSMADGLLTGRNLIDTITTEHAPFRRGNLASPARQIAFAPQIRLDDLNSKTTASLSHD